MHSAKEKISNMASAAKERVNIRMANVEEKVNLEGVNGGVTGGEATARTEEEKQIAHERRKAKEAQAKMELHEAKARHAEDKLRAKVSHHFPAHYHEPPLVGAHHGHNEHVVGHHGHRPVGTAVPMAGTAVPSYPLGGNPTPPRHMRHYQG